MDKNTYTEDFDRLNDLAHMLCDEAISDDEYGELEKLLKKSDALKSRYVALMQISSGLRDWAYTVPTEDEAQGKFAIASSSQEKMSGSKQFPSRKSLVLCVAAMLSGIFFLGIYVGGNDLPGLWQPRAPDTALVDDEGALRETEVPVEPANAHYVARVVEVSHDATWGQAKPREFLLRLTGNETIELQTGTAHVEFSSGASVILHGPTTFVSLTHDTGRLMSGRVTGRAENGNFSLLTPTAEVIDLGTEFGVSIDDSLNTDVCVFDGEVDVSPASTKASGRAASTVRLAEGMAVRVDRNGVIDDSLNISRSEFRRYVPKLGAGDGKQDLICLVDIIAGGNGRREWLAGAIDPSTGSRDRHLSGFDSKFDRHSDGQYLTVSGSPLIDGVFIPSAEEGAVQLDSSGNAFDLGGNSSGATWGPIWSRRLVPRLRATTSIVSDFWGTDTLEGVLDILEKSNCGVVGMHSNVGLTVDLRAIRMLEGRSPSHFHAGICNLDNSAVHDPNYAKENRPAVDFRVFVDGTLKFKQLNFGRDDGEVSIDLKLSNKDRFLTIVTTDAGDMRFDHLMLIDPVLKLGERKRNESEANSPQLDNSRSNQEQATNPATRPT